MTRNLTNLSEEDDLLGKNAWRIVFEIGSFLSFRRRPKTTTTTTTRMSLFQSLSLGLILIIASLVDHAGVDATKQPLILDSDYGPFIDDVFALGLLINSDDMIDMKFIIATSEQPELSAKCMAAQLKLSGRTDVPVAVGSSFPAYELRGSVCAIPGILGFAMEPECLKYSNGTTVIDNGVEYMANMIMESGIDNWWYLVVGGQSSLKALIELYPEAAAKIDTLIVMAGNWCADFYPYPDVYAPTDETNIGCDPGAANYNLDANNIKFNHVYYVPVELADEIGGDDYKIFVDAAMSGSAPAAAATLDWYKIWSNASRADDTLLVNAEAFAYDPETESTPQFDPAAVMLALELLSENCKEPRIALFEMEGIHFLEPGDDGLQPFPAAPRAAFSLFTGFAEGVVLPDQCPNMTNFTFRVDDTPEMEYPVMVALGFTSPEAKAAVYSDMARRMAGEKILCGFVSPDEEMDGPSTTAPGGGGGAAAATASGAAASAPTFARTVAIIGLALSYYYVSM